MEIIKDMLMMVFLRELCRTQFWCEIYIPILVGYFN